MSSTGPRDSSGSAVARGAGRFVVRLFTPRISMKDMALVTSQWAMLYKSGVPIHRCFTVMAEQTRNRTAKHTLIRVADSIEQGATLEQALRSEDWRLPPIFVESLSCAEVSGRFDDALDHVVAYFEDWLRYRRAIVKAITYPTLVIVCWIFIIPFVIGLFVMAFGGAGDSDFTSFILRWLIRTLTIVVIFYGMAWFLVRSGIGPWIWGAVGTFVWPFGRIVRGYAHARFFRMLAILLGGGVYPKDAVQRAATLTTNPIIAADIRRAIPFLEKSATLEEALARAYLLPRMTREVLALGEQTGRGPELFEKTANWLHEEADHRLKVLIYMIEGVLIILIGIAIVL